MEPGMVLMGQSWWKPAVPGVVVRVGMSKVSDPYAVAYVELKELVIGDKLATSDGLTFTIGEKMPHKDMPVLLNENTSNKFIPNLLIITNKVNRGLTALVRHINACTARFDSVTSFRRMQIPMGIGVLTLRQHYPSTMTRSIKVPRGRYRRGTPSVSREAFYVQLPYDHAYYS